MAVAGRRRRGERGEFARVCPQLGGLAAAAAFKVAGKVAGRRRGAARERPCAAGPLAAYCWAFQAARISLPVADHTPARREMRSSTSSTAAIRCGTPLIQGRKDKATIRAPPAVASRYKKSKWSMTCSMNCADLYL